MKESSTFFGTIKIIDFMCVKLCMVVVYSTYMMIAKPS